MDVKGFGRGLWLRVLLGFRVWLHSARSVEEPNRKSPS